MRWILPFLVASILLSVQGCVIVPDITGRWRLEIIDEQTLNFIFREYVMRVENVDEDGNVDWEMSHSQCYGYSGTFDRESRRIELTFWCFNPFVGYYAYKMSGEVSGNTMGGTLWGKLEEEYDYSEYGVWSATKTSDEL